MNISGNTRFQLIEEIIEKAVFSLLKRRKYDGFFVKDICTEAGINRSTFYAHYTDINDLMYKIEKKLSAKISSIWGAKTDYSNPDEIFLSLFNFVQDNKFFYRAYLKGNQNVFVELEMIKKMKPIFQNELMHRGIHYSETEIEYHLCFFGAGLKIVCAKWLEHNCTETPEQMLQIIKNEYVNNSNIAK